MKSVIVCILTVIFLTVVGCNDSRTRFRKQYVESKPSFYKLRHGGWLTNEWIRKPGNLLTIHETFKRFGYIYLANGLLSDDLILVQDLYINKPGYKLLDSLVLTYKGRQNGSNYYKEFWARREKEKNDSVVFVIISDIQYAFETKMTSGILQMRADTAKVNDTLKNLLEIEFRYNTLTKSLAMHDFETLRRLGFHQSASNLLFERYSYQDIKWNRDSLAKTLQESDTSVYAWFEDDTK